MASIAYKDDECSCTCYKGELSNWKTAERCKGCSCQLTDCSGCFKDGTGMVVIDEDPFTGGSRKWKVVFDEPHGSVHVKLASDGSIPDVADLKPVGWCKWARRLCCRIKLVSYDYEKGWTTELKNLSRWTSNRSSVAE